MLSAILFLMLAADQTFPIIIYKIVPSDRVVPQNKYLGDRRNVVCDSFSYVGGGPNISNYHFLSFSFEAHVNTISSKVYITVLLVQPKIEENKNDIVHRQCLN